MDIQTIFNSLKYDPNDPQKEAIEKIKGPLLIIAGPGSGKTQTLIARTLNLLLMKEVPPEEIMVCTFTEKAAATLKDRLRQALISLGKQYDIELESLLVGTVHSLCNDILIRHIDELETTSLRLIKGYEVLDDITQELFLKEHQFNIFGKNLTETYGKGVWNAIGKATRYFNFITEELIDETDLIDSEDEHIARIGRQYARYKELLASTNTVDFSHLQKLALEFSDIRISGRH